MTEAERRLRRRARVSWMLGCVCTALAAWNGFLWGSDVTRWFSLVAVAGCAAASALNVRQALSYQRAARAERDVGVWQTGGVILPYQVAPCPVCGRVESFDHSGCAIAAVPETWSPEAVVGWRTWSLDSSGLLIGGYGATWASAEVEAVCVRGPYARYRTPLDDRDGEWPELHLAPDPRCWCGIYAWRRKEDLLGPFVGLGAPVAVVGEVELSGRVIEHEFGYRAQRARITRLWAPAPREVEMVDVTTFGSGTRHFLSVGGTAHISPVYAESGVRVYGFEQAPPLIGWWTL